MLKTNEGAIRVPVRLVNLASVTLPGFELVRVPAGEFLYGEDRRKVTLPEYYIVKTPIINAQYKVFVEATGYRAPGHWAGGQIPRGKENHPVVNVSWEDIQAFCRWAGLRLPTEAEWEKVARGTDGRKYPWEDAEPTAELCNFDMNVKDTTMVERYSPAGNSPYGCAEVAGNVWEWTGGLWGKDWAKPAFGYPYVAGDGQEDQTAGTDVLRVVRGGSWYSFQWVVRAADRSRFLPDSRYVGLGFRCVLSP